MWSAFTPLKWKSIKLLSIVVNKHSFTDYMIDTWEWLDFLMYRMPLPGVECCYLEACPMWSDINEWGNICVD